MDIATLAVAKNYTDKELIRNRAIDFVDSYGTEFINMESTTGWTTSGCSIATDTSNVADGDISAIKLTPTVAGVLGTMDYTISRIFSETDILSLRIYIPNYDHLSTFRVYISSNASFSGGYYLATLQNGNNNLRTGWNVVKLMQDDFQVNGTQSWDSTMVKIRFSVTPKSGKICATNFGTIRLGEKSTPKVVISFDDGMDSVYTKAYPYMNARNIKGTAYINSNSIGSANRMTLDNLKTLYNNGWDIGNHTAAHSHLTALTLAQATADIKDCRNYLLGHGFERSANHFAYPYGEFNETTLRAVIDADCLTARRTGTYASAPSTRRLHQQQPSNNRLTMISAISLEYDVTLDDFKSSIDDVIKYGSVLMVYGHSVVASGAVSTEINEDIFQGIIDYIVLKGIDAMTISEYYDSINASKSMEAKKFPKHNLLYEVFDDFNYQTLTEINTPWILNKGSDGATTDPAIASGKCGRVALTTGADAAATMATDGSQFVCAIPVQASYGGLVAETKLKINSAITGVSVNFGLTDTTSLEEPFSIGALNAITAVASDAACFVYDDGADTKSWFACAVDSGTQDADNTNITSELIENCEDIWNEQTIANVTAAIDSVDYKVGTSSAKFTVADGFGTGIIASEAITSASLISNTHISLWVKSDVNLNAGDYQLLLDNTALCASPLETLDLPAITANTWTLCKMKLSNPSALTAVISIGLNQVVDKGAMILLVDDVRAYYQGTFPPIADIEQTLRIEVDNLAKTINFYIDKKLVKTLTDACISPDVNLYATVTANSTGAASKVVEVDYMYVSHCR